MVNYEEIRSGLQMIKEIEASFTKNKYKSNDTNYVFQGADFMKNKVCSSCGWSPATEQSHITHCLGECGYIKHTYDHWFEGDKLCIKQKVYDRWENSKQHHFHICACGGKFTYGNVARHYKTEIHQKYLNKI